METRREVHFGGRVVRCFYPRPAHVNEMLQAAVDGYPDALALICEDARISYHQLDEISANLASHLLALGVGKGDRVAVLLGNCPEYVYCALAAIRIRAIVVPIDIRLQTPELAYVLAHSGAKCLIHEARLGHRLPTSSDTPELQYRYVVNGKYKDSPNLSNLLQDRSGELPPINPDEEDTAVILYTSGTTGRPKGAMLTHFGLVHSTLHYQQTMRLNRGQERSMMAVPATHVTGLVANILTMLYVAGCTVMMPVFKARTFLELAARERITHTVMVPAMYKLCLLDAEFERFDLSAWRTGAYGGAPMPDALIAELAVKLPRLQLMNAYGSTETTSPSTLMPLGETANHADSVGKAVSCAELLVMDADGREVPAGEAGEVWIKGPMVAAGYWDNPTATQASFVGGYWRSGDIGALDSDGYLRVFDRLKDMINRGGYKIYSIEVENVLSRHPDVIECAVVAQADPVLGEKIHAFVHPCRELAVEDIKTFCATQLADYKVPDFVTLCEQPLPRNANGKLLKRELREWAQCNRVNA